MTRECGGHTWTYDRERRLWSAADGALVVFVGRRGADGHTATWMPRRTAIEFPSLTGAMEDEVDAKRAEVYWLGERDRLDRMALENATLRDELAYFKEVCEGLAKRGDKVAFWRTMAAIWLVAAVVGLLT